MEKNRINNLSQLALWAIVLVTNLFFVCKYIPRAGVNPLWAAAAYALVFVGLVYVYRCKLAPLVSERWARVGTILLTAGIVGFIACVIAFVPPLSVQVDRWSATTYFLDALFRGVYPYGVHTHVSETNFPSPFPLWHYLNIPFWLIGDVGWIQVFFLLVFLAAVYVYFRSWRAVMSALLVLYVSPAYWWELVTRSDGLSNALLVCSCVLLMERFDIRIGNKWWLVALIAGCLASTRLSAIIPVALYLFHPWLQANWKVKVGFLGIVIAVVACAFAPYVFWDTDSWIFFQRNPFMSQTAPGSPWILGAMIVLAIAVACREHSFYYYLCTTALFLFAFMLFTQLGVVWRFEDPVTLLDNCCDISYFTLSFPFAITALSCLAPDR